MRNLASRSALAIFLWALSARAQSPSEPQAVPSATFATPESAADTGEAVRLAHEGKAQFEAGHPKQALALFERAKAIAASPTIDLYIARARKALGDWTGALSAYRECLAAGNQEKKAAWEATQTTALDEKAELERTIPRLSIQASGLAPGEQPEVLLDGRKLNWPTEGEAMNPGSHSLILRTRSQTKSFEVFAIPSETTQLKWQAEVIQAEAPPPLPLTPEAKVSGGRSLAPERPNSTFVPWIWLASGTTVVALGVGTAMGATAWSQADELKAYCRTDGNVCSGNGPEDDTMRDKQNQSRLFGDISTVSFAIASVTLATSVTLLALHLSHRNDHQVTVRWVAPSGLSVAGTF
jgi:hypothetical protein